MNRPDSSASEETNVSRAAGVVGAFTLLSRILGLARDMVLAYFFGTRMAMDAFVAAFKIPNLLRRLFAEGSLTIVFIPVFTEYLTHRTREEAFDLARCVLTLLTLCLACVAFLGILFAPWIVRLQAWGFGTSGPRYELTVMLTRITFPYIFFISLVAFFMGVLNSCRRFAAPAAAPVFLNVGIIGAACLLSPRLEVPVAGVAAGVLIGGILQVALQVPWVLKEGLRFIPKWNPSHPAIRRMGVLMLPAVFGSAVYQLNSYIGTFLASFLREGSISWLYYADRLVQFPLGVFAIAVSTAALPSLSTQAAENDLERFGDTLRHSLCLVFFIILPSMAGLMILGGPIVRILLQRGSFDAHATLMTFRALLFYTAGLWAFSGIRVMVSAFYALQDTKTPVKVAVAAFVINLVASLMLMGPLQHGGIALALSVSAAAQFCLLVFLLRRKVDIGSLKPVLSSAVKSLTAALVMGGGVFYAESRWLSLAPGGETLHSIIRLAALLGIGVVLYFSAAWILRCRELASVRVILSPLFGNPGHRRSP